LRFCLVGSTRIVLLLSSHVSILGGGTTSTRFTPVQLEPHGSTSKPHRRHRTNRPSRHRLGPLHMPLKAKLGSRNFSRARRAQRSTVWPRYPNCGQDAATFETGPRVSRDQCPRRSAHNRPMPLEIHTEPNPDHFCETCGGPSELISQSITSWDGNETMAREVSPWTPSRCADPWCQSRRPRHRR
jgi:hypothetical protein